MEDLLFWKDVFVTGALMGAVIALGVSILFLWSLR